MDVPPVGTAPCTGWNATAATFLGFKAFLLAARAASAISEGLKEVFGGINGTAIFIEVSTAGAAGFMTLTTSTCGFLICAVGTGILRTLLSTGDLGL